ncbi:hypothetical protein KKA94_03000, partial [Patescibacteria group bacterium]|nr:hypothetical protein [Patescibacteria group bacterium]
MKFFQTHFTKHHLLHSPHKWFLALLISPIHVAEMHYKNRYHINFVHAKKLFVFDMALVLSIFLLLAGTIFWFIYDPTVTKDVALSFQTTQTRINSGEKIVFTAHYQNNSEVLLTNASLGLRLPNSLVITSAEPKDSFDEQNNTFYLQNLVPGSSGEVNISGILYGEVDKEYNNTAILTYNQEERSASEQVVASTITILRNSVLQASIEAPTAILSHSTVPITLKIKNNGELLLENIKIPLSDVENFSISPIEEPKVGTVESGSWIITNLAPGREVEIKLNM